ncbi:MAG TPA: hypothetical protein VMZ69_05755 [Saprospiraceae bacterium]|nr:hypothetical protein [Saprospiraceae bacterium]
MKYSLLTAITLLTLSLSCKKTDTQIETKSDCPISGTYLNKTVLDQCPGKMPVDVPYYALELSFNSSDSVAISNGVEKYKLPFKSAEGDCGFKIDSATQFGDMYFTVTGDSILQLHDSAWTKVNNFSTFAKINNPTRENWDFENYLNECAIAGNYMITKKDGKSSPVYFLPNGQITGIKPYLAYTVCYAGDCLEETEIPSRLIELSDDKGGIQLFAYTMTEDRSSVKFYKVGEVKPDIKGERTIGELAFELSKDLSTQ